MGSVTVVTKKRVDDIAGEMVTEADIIESSGHLILTKVNGTRYDLGRVVPDLDPYITVPGPLRFWPVGSVMMTTDNVNPEVSLGGGTWIRWGNGRAVVGVDESRTEFEVPERLGGEKEHRVTIGEFPTHGHYSATGGRSADHSHEQTVLTGGRFASGQRKSFMADATNALQYQMGTNTQGSSEDHSHAISGDGQSQTHNNLQPFETTYMWKRTA